jgi:hypothetical protein
MDQNRKWSLAWSELDSLRKNLPQSIMEKHVAEFHRILSLLHEATGEEISAFRIPDEEVKPVITSARRTSYTGRPGGRTYSDEKYCDRDLMMRKIDATYGYFSSLMPPAQTPKFGF